MSDFQDSCVEPLLGSSPSTGDAPVFEPILEAADPKPANDILSLVTTFRALRKHEEELAALPGDIDGERLDAISLLWHKQRDIAEELADRHLTVVSEIACKASLYLNLGDMDYMPPEFLQLVLSIARDAAYLGSERSVFNEQYGKSAISAAS